MTNSKRPALHHEQDPSSPSFFSEVALSPALSDEVRDVALTMSGDVYEESFAARGEFIGSTTAITDLLRDTDVGDRLRDLKEGKIVGLKLDGLPTDPVLPPAPIDGGRPIGKATFVSESVAVGIAHLLGYPSMMLGEKKEALVHQITPVPGKETSQSNEGQVDLQFHQDLAPNPDIPDLQYHLTMPDWLILTGIRSGSKNTKTYMVSVDEVVSHLSPETLAVLRQERFVTNPPDSFLETMPEAAKRLPVHPVLIDQGGYFESAFDKSSGLRPAGGVDDYDAVASLSEFETALARFKREVIIEPGTAIAFNNRRIIHGRSSVNQEEDLALKRWIQRVYVYDTGRIGRQAIGFIGRSLQIGGGIIRLGSFHPGERMLELSGVVHRPKQ